MYDHLEDIESSRERTDSTRTLMLMCNDAPVQTDRTPLMKHNPTFSCYSDFSYIILRFYRTHILTGAIYSFATLPHAIFQLQITISNFLTLRP